MTLSKKVDKWDVPIPHVECEWGENERLMTSHMQTTINESIKCSGGEVLSFNQLFKIPFGNSLVKNAVALKQEAPPPGYYIHEVGGAPMSDEEELGVVDKFNRLWRCKNVLVVDGACWPTSGWQSPTLTMMAITRRACVEALRPLREQKDR